MLNGIDIASYQASLVPSKMATTDFIIVKSTGGASYSNPCFKKHADATLKAGKLLGVYHFARDRGYEGSATAEADHFIKAFKPYIGKAIPFLDWEASAVSLGVLWAKSWLDRVHAKTGIKPGIYMSKSTCNNYNWSSVAKAGYFLWAAQYPNYEPTGYNQHPWTDLNPFGAWGKPKIFQYASTGRITGYNDNLDLDLFYGDKSDWQKLCGASVASGTSTAANSAASTSTKVIKRGQVAADIHKRMVNDNRFGYSWEERWGAKPERWTVDGVTFDINVGDYDCSSSCITAWKKALTGTKYAKSLDGATYTGNMRSVFVNSGLFAWKPISFIASPGDLYLNEQNHVAMCQRQKPDELSEFSWGDNGAYGNKRGDQSGREAAVNPYYDYPWDGILHYNGKADSEAPSPEPTPTPKPATAPTWRVSTDKSGKSWLTEKSTGKAGKAIRWLAIKGAGKYRVFTRANGWLPWVTAYNIKDLENGCAGDGSVIEGVQVKSGKYRYAVRVLNGSWYPDMIGTHDTGGSNDNFAGDLANAIDGFRISLA